MKAPRSMPVVPSQTRWEMIRLISQAITRSTVQRSVISMPHQLLGRQRQADVVRHRRQVVGPVGERDDLVVVPVLAQLLEAGVQVADVRDAPAAPSRRRARAPAAARRGSRDAAGPMLISMCSAPKSSSDGSAPSAAAHAERDRARAALGVEPGRGRAPSRRCACSFARIPRSPRRQPLPHVGRQLVVRLGDATALPASSAPRDWRRAPGGSARPAEVAAQREVLPQRDSPRRRSPTSGSGAGRDGPRKATPNMSNTSRSSQSAPRQRSHTDRPRAAARLSSSTLTRRSALPVERRGAGRPPRAAARDRGTPPR